MEFGVREVEFPTPAAGNSPADRAPGGEHEPAMAVWGQGWESGIRELESPAPAAGTPLEDGTLRGEPAPGMGVWGKRDKIWGQGAGIPSTWNWEQPRRQGSRGRMCTCNGNLGSGSWNSQHPEWEFGIRDENLGSGSGKHPGSGALGGEPAPGMGIWDRGWEMGDWGAGIPIPKIPSRGPKMHSWEQGDPKS